MLKEPGKEQELIYRLIEYGIDKEIIVRRKLFIELNLTDLEQNYFDEVLAARSNLSITPNNLYVLFSHSASTNPDDDQFRLTPTALFHYSDYKELKEARSNAVSAKYFSIGAIILSLIATIITGYQTYLAALAMKID